MSEIDKSESNRTLDVRLLEVNEIYDCIEFLKKHEADITIKIKIKSISHNLIYFESDHTRNTITVRNCDTRISETFDIPQVTDKKSKEMMIIFFRIYDHILI